MHEGPSPTAQPLPPAPEGAPDDPVPRDARHVTILLVGRLVNELGEDHLCRIRNISSRGLMLESRTCLKTASPLTIELRSLHTIEGSVVWARAPRSGVQFATPADIVELLHTSRENMSRVPRAPRISTQSHALIRREGRTRQGVLLDLSQRGGKLRADELLPNDQITLVLPDMAPRQAAVRWVRDGEAGVVFHDLIPFARLDEWLQDPVRRGRVAGIT